MEFPKGKPVITGKAAKIRNKEPWPTPRQLTREQMEREIVLGHEIANEMLARDSDDELEEGEL